MAAFSARRIAIVSIHKEIDFSKLKTYSIAGRYSKVNTAAFAKPGKLDMTAFLDSLPDILAAKDFKELIGFIKQAKAKGKPLILGLGGHVIKCGLAPLLIELIEAGYVQCLVSNGSVMIHDYEIAMFGSTSEDVSVALTDGSFGMAQETTEGLNRLAKEAATNGDGLGETVGRYLSEHAANKELSLLAAAFSKGIPFCIQVAIGTDIIHQSPYADGAALGKASMKDFRIFAAQVTKLNAGGVFINFGSAVIIPEVFLKALTVARNVTGEVKDFYTAVFDMNMHYRARVNVVQRPVETGGKGYYFIGQHEIMIPLLVKSLL